MPQLVETSIRIEQPPSVVRGVVLDFPNLSKWHTSFLKILRPIPETKAPSDMQPGDELYLKFLQVVTIAKIVQNDANGLEWEGGPAYLFHGSHFIRFEPLDDGKATLVRHGEAFTGVFGYGVGLPGIFGQTKRLYEGFNGDLKRKCEEAK